LILISRIYIILLRPSAPEVRMNLPEPTMETSTITAHHTAHPRVWLAPEHLLSAPLYEALRARCRDAFIDLRRRRRVRVTPGLSVLFEGLETVLLQVYEVLRAEGWELARAQRELAEYARLLPGPTRLSATAMIDSDNRAHGLHLARSLRRRGALVLRAGGLSAPSEPVDDERDDSPVHYLGFTIDTHLAAAIARERPLILAIDADSRAEVELAPELVRELARDLTPDPDPDTTPLLRGLKSSRTEPQEHHP